MSLFTPVKYPAGSRHIRARSVSSVLQFVRLARCVYPLARRTSQLVNVEALESGWQQIRPRSSSGRCAHRSDRTLGNAPANCAIPRLTIESSLPLPIGHGDSMSAEIQVLFFKPLLRFQHTGYTFLFVPPDFGDHNNERVVRVVYRVGQENWVETIRISIVQK